MNTEATNASPPEICEELDIAHAAIDSLAGDLERLKTNLSAVLGDVPPGCPDSGFDEAPKEGRPESPLGLGLRELRDKIRAASEEVSDIRARLRV